MKRYMDRRTEDREQGRTPPQDAMARAIERREWERLSLHLLLSAALVTRLPAAAIDDVLALFDREDVDAS